MAELKVRNLNFTYNNRNGVFDVNLHLSPGIYGLIGPNGAGKTTLIKLLTSLLDANSGEIRYDNKLVKDHKNEYRNLIGLMPQHNSGYEEFSASRFLYYIATIKGLNKQQANQTIQELVGIVGLNNDLDKKIKQYSGGMRQRLMFCSALIGHPKILILDEPTAGLDPKERIVMRNFISQLSQDKIVILATHVMQDIESIAKEIILIGDGRIIQQDSPNNLLNDITGYVCEATLSNTELEDFSKKYRISNVSKIQDKNFVRYLSSEKTESKVVPTLEDVYLKYFT